MTMNFLTWYIPVTVVATLWSLANFPCQVSAACSSNSFAKVPSGDATLNKYAVVIDAGSSGSRIHVYGWKKEEDRLQLPDILHIFCASKDPGISSLTGNAALKSHVRSLIKEAKPYVPDAQHAESPIYFLGTAGMRLMTERQANDATDFIDQLLKNDNENPFLYLPHAKARVLSGEEEGLFSWIAANYQEKEFVRDEDTNTITTNGNLDLGGGSTQIAFAPRGNILANKFPVRLAGTRFNLYVHSYLGYGLDEVAKWIRQQIYKKSPETTIEDPCLLKNYSLSATIDSKAITFNGKGDADGCTELLEGLTYNPPDPSRCNPKPCSIGTTYQPPIQDTKNFYVTGVFIHPLKTMNVLKDQGQFSLQDLSTAAKKFCSTPVDELMKKSNKSEDGLAKDCLAGLYMSVLFEKGYGFKADTTQLKVPGLNSEIEWPKGCVIYENERLRCDASA